MAVEIKFNGNPNLFLKDPDLSNIGKRILQQGAEVLLELGYEDFTFKKMALRIGTTEATVYRYFENKHRYLLYLLSWYWNIMQFIIESETRHLKTDREKIERIIDQTIDIQSSDHALTLAFDRVVRPPNEHLAIRLDKLAGLDVSIQRFRNDRKIALINGSGCENTRCEY